MSLPLPSDHTPGLERVSTAFELGLRPYVLTLLRCALLRDPPELEIEGLPESQRSLLAERLEEVGATEEDPVRLAAVAGALAALFLIDTRFREKAVRVTARLLERVSADGDLSYMPAAGSTKSLLAWLAPRNGRWLIGHNDEGEDWKPVGEVLDNPALLRKVLNGGIVLDCHGVEPDLPWEMEREIRAAAAFVDKKRIGLRVERRKTSAHQVILNATIENGSLPEGAGGQNSGFSAGTSFSGRRE